MNKNEENRESIFKQLSIDNVMKDCKWISEETPWRLSGSKASEKAARYIVNKLEQYNLDAKLLETYGYLNFPEKAELKVTSPINKDIQCNAFAQIGSTKNEGIEADVVYVGPGGEEDYKDKDVKGKIILCELSYAPPRPEKVRIAAEKGAIGVIMMNWGSDDNPLLPNGTVKSVWGNPTPGNIHLMENTPPVVGISRRDGVYLKGLLSKNKNIRIWLRTKSERKWLKVFMPYGEIKAENGDENYVLVGAHMDSWAQGASDNASGNACKIEIARVLKKNSHLLKHDVRFCFWQCHETGIMEGSTWFVDKFWSDLDEKCIAYLNYDSPGMEGTSVWRTDISSELDEWGKKIEDKIIPDIPKKHRKVERTGDQSFFGIGIPSLCSWMVHTDEEIKKWNGAILGEWYHSIEDTMEHIDKDILNTCLKVYAGYTFDLASNLKIPTNFVPVADDILGRLLEIKRKLKSRPDIEELLEFNPVIEKALDFKKSAMSLNNISNNINDLHIDEVNEINGIYKFLSRKINPIKCTISGRFDQDTYGLSALKHDIPTLQSIDNIINFGEKSHNLFLWATKIRRDRNKIEEALRHSIDRCNSIIHSREKK